MSGRHRAARRDFALGELVEEAPVIVFEEPIATLPRDIERVVFNWLVPDNTTDRHALVLGYGSLYNHANPATMRWEADPANFTIKYIAVRSIRAGEELTINYNAVDGGATWQEDNGFERMQVEPIAEKPDEET